MTGTQWVTTIAGILGALTGAAALVNAFVGRGKTRAEATQILTGSAVAMMTEFEADAKAARTEAAEVRVELRAVRDEARALAEELHRLRIAIMRPGATIEGLRVLVSAGPGPSANGRPA